MLLFTHEILLIIFGFFTNSEVVKAEEEYAKNFNQSTNEIKWLKVGESAVLDCHLYVTEEIDSIYWTSNRGLNFTHSAMNSTAVTLINGSIFSNNDSLAENNFRDYYECEQIVEQDRFHVLENGSLFILCVTRKDAGNFTCFSNASLHYSYNFVNVIQNATAKQIGQSNLPNSLRATMTEGNSNINSANSGSIHKFQTAPRSADKTAFKNRKLLSFSSNTYQSNFTGRNSNHSASQPNNASYVVQVRLNYSAISSTSLESIIAGLATSGSFFIVACVLGVIRYLNYICSQKEENKRRGIRQVLTEINGFKLAAAQMDKFSAYRTAKIDSFLAFKSATLDQWYAYRTTRIDRLRTYKQASVAALLGHLERMRDHYQQQSSRIRDNCTMQAENLKTSYGFRCHRFKDYRSQKAERLRDNYQLRLNRIRDYSQSQLTRLRDQYKAQQLHVLKLLELIDVGNCLTIVEAECMRAESVIFSETPIVEVDDFPSLENLPEFDCGDGEEFMEMEFPDNLSGEYSSLEDLPASCHSSSGSKIPSKMAANNSESVYEDGAFKSVLSDDTTADRSKLKLDLVAPDARPDDSSSNVSSGGKKKKKGFEEKSWLEMPDWNDSFLKHEDLWNCFIDAEFQLGLPDLEKDDGIFGLVHDFSQNGSVILKRANKGKRWKGDGRSVFCNLSPKKNASFKSSPEVDGKTCFAEVNKDVTSADFKGFDYI